ncbi:MAG TPA: TraR/DksA C4-type zinc finger protein [Caulobacter sp.]|nr:TraR/DksA C4-type zinc finger protein [Caulobacter sp.]
MCRLCGEDIPEGRRRALPGCRTCIACQAGRDKQVVLAASIAAAARTASCADPDTRLGRPLRPR